MIPTLLFLLEHQMAPAMASFPTAAAEHSELVEEMLYIEKLPVGERIKLAQKRRKQQLSNYAKWIKTDPATKPAKQKTRRGIVFSVLAQLMEAAARGSHDEMRTLLKTGKCHWFVCLFFTMIAVLLVSDTNRNHMVQRMMKNY